VLLCDLPDFLLSLPKFEKLKKVIMVVYGERNLGFDQKVHIPAEIKRCGEIQQVLRPRELCSGVSRAG